MTLRLKLALTVLATGLLTALLVLASVLYAFQRFEREMTYHSANDFLLRVVRLHDDLFDLHARQPEEFREWLKNLVLFRPDTQLYLLDANGTVLASGGEVQLPPGFRVAIGPVRSAAGPSPGPYVMGDDPERMDADAIVAAQPVRRSVIRNTPDAAGYLYLVCHSPQVPVGGWQALRASIARPASWLIIGIVTLTTALAAWAIVSVTRPLRRLTDEVVAWSRDGLGSDAGSAPPMSSIALTSADSGDEIGQLAAAFRSLADKLRAQWGALQRMDHFRREGVSNLSHDLRSPLTATAACLETLDGRWAGDTARGADRELVEVALRNTRNAARLVQSLGDLARLDEPEFSLRRERVDLRELIDDVQVRYADRAARQGVRLTSELGAEPVVAAIDIELLERCLANLLDNALKFTPAGGGISLSAKGVSRDVILQVCDTGSGIAAQDLPHLFDRFYQSRQSTAPATGEGGKGLGLAIVKRIAELHGGEVAVTSAPGKGTCIRVEMPADRPDPA